MRAWGSQNLRIKAMYENAPKTARRLQIAQPHDRKISICCYGPSLSDSRPIYGDLMTVGGAALKICSDYHVECDPRRDRIEYVTSTPSYATRLLASCCHPDVVDTAIKIDEISDNIGQTTLWHCWNSVADDNWVRKNEPDYWTVKAGSNAGLNAIMIAYVLGYRDIHVFGMDCSYADGETHAGAHYGVPEKRIVHRFNGKDYETSRQLLQAATEYFALVSVLPGASVTIHGKGLLQDMAAKVMADTLARRKSA